MGRRWDKVEHNVLLTISPQYRKLTESYMKALVTLQLIEMNGEIIVPEEETNE